MQMKKFLIFMVFAVVCCSTAQAQRYYIPRYKKQKEVRDHYHFNLDRRFTITMGASFDMNLGMQTHIKLDNDASAVNYDEDPDFPGVTATLGLGYRLGEHLVAGVEAGYNLSDSNSTIPVYGAFKWYYGKNVRQHRTRWFNYLNIGPQFYTGSKYKPVGAVAAAGGGMRIVAAGSLRMDLFVGYRMGLIRPKASSSGSYDVPASQIDYKQFLHGIQVGINIALF